MLVHISKSILVIPFVNFLYISNTLKYILFHSGCAAIYVYIINIVCWCRWSENLQRVQGVGSLAVPRNRLPCWALWVQRAPCRPWSSTNTTHERKHTRQQAALFSLPLHPSALWRSSLLKPRFHYFYIYLLNLLRSKFVFSFFFFIGQKNKEQYRV